MQKLLICIISMIWLIPNVSSLMPHLTKLNPTYPPSETFDFPGFQANMSIGYSLGAGDVNGDGFSDIIFAGCSIGDPHQYLCKGIVYVLFGNPDRSFNVDLNNLTSTQGFTFKAAESPASVQLSVSGTGDVNGDGIDDIIIGDSAVSSVRGRAGAAYVIFGSKTELTDIDLNNALNSTQGFQINGATAYDQIGSAVNAAGDVNGDGIDDVIIGTYFANNYIGAAYIIYGSSKALPNIDLSKLNKSQGIKISGTDIFDFFGSAVSGAGDVNADGVDDIIIGSFSATVLNRNNAGTAYVIFGSKNLSDIDVGKLTSSQGFQIMGAQASDSLGYSVSKAGDINADGIADIIIGAQAANLADRPNAGAAYVIYGSSKGFANIDLNNLSKKQGFKIVGPTQNAMFGTAVSGVGDVNEDGIDDVLIGASFAALTDFASTGAAYTIYGGKDEPSLVDTLYLNKNQGVLLMAQYPLDMFRCSVSSAGDIDGDGLNDVIIGACDAIRGGLGYAGEASIVFAPIRSVY